MSNGNVSATGWVDVSYGKPCHWLPNVYVRTENGLVYKCHYDRNTHKWKREDGTIVNRIVAWKLIPKPVD